VGTGRGKGRQFVSRQLFRKTLGRTWRKRHHSWLRHAWHLVGNRPDAEDVVQDAVCQSLQAEPDLEDEREADAYLHAAIRSISYKHLHRRRKGVQVQRSAAPGERRREIGKSPLEIVLAAEQRHEEEKLIELAEHGIEELPTRVREALELVVLRESPLKLREVAEIQGVSITTVHKRVRKAYEVLRVLTEALGSEADDDDTGGAS
jgi:RNA polymerase sigma factor (sigma-70 family)